MRVDPIRSMKDVNAIKKLLHDSPRDYMLFVLGINSGIRCGDLLKLRVSDVKDCIVGDKLTIVEGKTKKVNYIYINNEIYKAIHYYLDNHEVKYEDEYLFKSRKGRNSPITIYYVGLLVAKWTSAINLKGHYKAHSLRKTFVTIQRLYYHVPIDLISRRLNHQSASVTRRYAGIIEDEVLDILKHEI